MTSRSLSSSLWSLLCSLKLAIILATLATALLVGGTVVMPAHPELFASMDSVAMGDWLPRAMDQSPRLSWWIAAAGVLLCLLTLNTLCCVIDWITHFGARWRKSGEYLLHLGFALIVIAYMWGAVSGYRSEGNLLPVGQMIPVPHKAGHYLQLEQIDVVHDANGRPYDRAATLSLIRGEGVLTQKAVQTNIPLTHKGLVALVTSYGRMPVGYLFLIPGTGQVAFSEGTTLQLPKDTSLRLMQFLPSAIHGPAGNPPIPTRSGQGKPALLFELVQPHQPRWQGWYFLGERIPFELVKAGVRLWPLEPVFNPYAILTINYDPGTTLASAGGICMLAGTLLAMCSFYAKRKRGEHPEI